MGEKRRKIKHNRIRCKLCGDVIESKYRHGFSECFCGACYTDGGREYIHRGWNPALGSFDDIIEDLTEYEDD